MTHTVSPVPVFETADVLERYNTHVTKHLSAALTEAGDFPIEVLNEVRAAFTHLAKAHTLGVGTPGYHEENACAMRHLKRASLDSLKVAILSLAERLQRQIDDLTTHVLLPAGLYQGLEALRDRRRHLMNAESSHPSMTTIDDLEALFVDYKNLELSLHTDYQASYVEMINARARKAKRRDMLWGFALGVLASIVATGIIALF